MRTLDESLIEGIVSIIELILSRENRQGGTLYKVEKGKHFIPADEEEISYNRELMIKLHFGVMLFVYILYEEDDKLSRKEIKEIKKLIDEKDGYLTKENVKELRKLLKTRPSLYDCVDYAKEYRLSYEYVSMMINHFRISLEGEKRYDYILDKVLREFVMEKDYLK